MTLNAGILIASFVLFIITPFAFRRKKHGDGPGAFAVGGKDYRWFSIAAGLSCTYVGGAALINLPSVAYTYGWYALADVIPAVLGLVVSAIVIVPLVRSKNAVSLGTYLESRGRFIAMVSGALAFVVYTIISGAQLMALAGLLSPIVDIDSQWIILIGALSVGSYILYNGYSSVTITDRVQFLVMLIGFVFVGGIAVISSNTLPEPNAPVPSQQMPMDLVALLAIAALFIPSSQDLHIRVHSAQSKSNAVIGCMVAAVAYLAFGVMSITIGIQSAELGLRPSSPDAIASEFLEQALGGWSIIPLIAILAAIISTLDSTIFSASTSLSFDISLDQTISGKPKKICPTLSTGIVLIIAVILALSGSRILGLIFSALVIYVSVLLPLLLGVALKVRERNLAILAALMLIASVAIESLRWTFPYRAFLICFAHSAVVILLYALELKKGRASNEATE